MISIYCGDSVVPMTLINDVYDGTFCDAIMYFNQIHENKTD